MTKISRPVAETITPQRVREGAGVHLQRSMPGARLDMIDPFLLFDHFGSDNPDDYLPGFPWHPHRGIETVTYMFAGAVNHRDSIGNEGTVEAGDVQWMSAGRGIMHEEMPEGRDGRMEGFQLWVNLPAAEKMSPPQYRDITAADIPLVTTDDGIEIRVIAGEIEGKQGPAVDIAADPLYLDVTLPAGRQFTHPVEAGHNAFAYLVRGSAEFGPAPERITATAPNLIVFGEGEQIEAESADSEARFFLIAGRPFNEPVARYGPFVMNTREEIEQTLREIREGTFITEGD